MGLDPNPSASPSSSPSQSSNGKRARDCEDEVYLDNLHSSKRYLSEMMASSLNGLTVGDSLQDNLMDSPARSESLYYFREEMPLQQYSPMSEDSDDSRFCETLPGTTYSSQPDSVPTCPVSPYRYQRPLSGFSCAGSSSIAHSLHSCVASTQSRPPRGSDSEGRFPSSPSDICHSADLRRAALLRSVQIRTQPLGPSTSYESTYGQGEQELPAPNMDTEEDHSCSYMKNMVDVVDERGYQIEDCSLMRMSEPDLDEEAKSCRVPNDEVTAEQPTTS
ncbi:hypothetical protein LINPERPRIM_LOCUS11032 [Linum perenne]